MLKKKGYFKMEKSLGPKLKEEYNLVRDNFQNKRNEINKDITQYKIIFEKAKKDISDLEKEVEELRPRIDNCDRHLVCKKCDIYSMKHLYSTPNPEKEHVYGCVICGHEERNT